MMKLKVAALILYNKEKKILLQHRTKDAPVLPDYWGFFGGSIEKKENPEDALHREIYEELRYKLKNPQFLLEQNFNYDTYQVDLFVFMEKYDETKKLELHEGQGMGWYTFEEAEKLKMHENNKIVLRKVKKYLS